MLNFKIRHLAKDDIQEIVNYYDSINTKITDVFLRNLYHEFEIIKSNPQIFHIKYKNTRVHYLKRFPIGIHFILEKNQLKL